MNNRAAFMDAMQGISEDYLIRHIKKKFPGREERLRKYTMVAAIYAAACLVAVLAIPLIIGGGDKPVEPGNDPVVIETVVTGKEGTETVTVTEESVAETEAVTVETTEATTTEETTTDATAEETTTETTTTTQSQTPEPAETTAGGIVIPPATVTPPVTAEPPMSSTPVKEEPKAEESSSKPQSSATETTVQLPEYDPSYKEALAVYTSKNLRGVEVTLGYDKEMYYYGDTIIATVTVYNRSRSTIYINSDNNRKSFLESMEWYFTNNRNDNYFIEYDMERLGCDGGLAPGEMWQIEFRSSLGSLSLNDPSIAWNNAWMGKANVEFRIGGVVCSESVELNIAHGVKTEETEEAVTTEPKTEGWDEPTNQVQLASNKVSRAFAGCEYTLTLDKESYTSEDRVITATVTLSDNGPHSVGMVCVGTIHPLDRFNISADGAVTEISHDDEFVGELYTAISSGQDIKFTKEILIDGLDPDADLVITCYITYDGYPDDGFFQGDTDTRKTAFLEITVPRE